MRMKLEKARSPAETGDRAGKDENWSLDHDSPDEEDWEVQSNEVEVPFAGIELSRMASRVTSRVWVLSLMVSDDEEEEKSKKKEIWIHCHFFENERLTPYVTVLNRVYVGVLVPTPCKKAARVRCETSLVTVNCPKALHPAGCTILSWIFDRSKACCFSSRSASPWYGIPPTLSG